MQIKLTTEQQDACDAVLKWFRKGSKNTFRLYGYAGTGKTTLARFIESELGVTVQYGAFTGKAAAVLRQKGCQGATTLHRILYHTSSVDGGFERRRKSPHEIHGDLFIIDETSMVNEELAGDLRKLGRRILLLGDPGQLPPVEGEEGFDMVRADFMLKEVHRQAEDSPVLRWATAVRRGQLLPEDQVGDSSVLKIGRLTDESVLLQAQQILVGQNLTRRWVNQRMRQIRGFDDPLPLEGDRLVCLLNTPKRGLFNGTLWTVRKRGAVSKTTVELDIVSADEPDEQREISVHRDFFESDEPDLLTRHPAGPAFDYGYALTVHKAQGSQWPHVVIFDEAKAHGDNANRWLYSAITRASETVTILKGPFRIKPHARQKPKSLA